MTMDSTSAGAMALSERIVLFHHHAPQGRRDAELLDAGLGIVRRRILLPHADNDLGADQFYLEGRSSTLASHAAAWTWWYSDAAAAQSAAQLNAAASCDSGAIYRSTD